MVGKKKNIHYAWVILLGCCLLQGGVLGVINNCRGIFYVPICEQLGFGLGDFTLYTLICSVSSCFLIPFVGRILEKYPVRIVLSAAVILFAGTVMLMGSFHHLYQWYVTAVFQGFASAFLALIPAPLIINNWFVRKKGTMMGISAAFSGVVGIVMNPIGTAMITAIGWRATQVLFGAICLVAVLPVTLFLIRFRPADMGLAPYGEQEQTEQTRDHLYAGVSSSIAVRSACFLCLLFAVAFINFANGFIQHFPAYTVSIGWSIGIGTAMVSVAMAGNVAAKFLLGAVHDLLGVKKTILFSLGLVWLACILLLIKSEPAFYLGALLCGVVMPVVSVLTPLLVHDLFGNRDYSTIFSYVTLVTSLTNAAGVTLIGYAYDLFSSYTFSLVLEGVLLWLAMALVVIAYRQRKKLIWEKG